VTREDALEHFCKLSAKVLQEVLDKHPRFACVGICQQRKFLIHQFDDEILEFIEKAVEEAIERKGAKS
jgi:hypothetical protein